VFTLFQVNLAKFQTHTVTTMTYEHVCATFMYSLGIQSVHVFNVSTNVI